MSQEKEFFSFEEALEELRLKEEELKRLVSEGEIRAFREGETMKLRRRDVESLRSELMGDEIVDLGQAGEELVFEDDAEFADAGMATEELGSAETLLEADLEVEELEVEDLDVDDLDMEDLDEEEGALVAPVASGRGRAEPEAPPEGALMIAVLILNAALLLLLVPVALSTLTGNLSGPARAVASLFAELPE